MRTWNVGKIKVTEVQELSIEVGLLDGLIAPATPEEVLAIDWMSDYANAAGQTLWDIHSYVVDTGEHRILIDAGCGNGKHYPMQPLWTELDTDFLQRLHEAGYAREDIDIVLCTHLHLDHIGWLAMKDPSGHWVPTFPNARLMLVEAEYQTHLDQMKAPTEVPAPAEAADDDDVDLIARAFLADDSALATQTTLVHEESIGPVVDAGLLELVPENGAIVEGVRYVSTPGHTAAHHSVRLESDGAEAFVTGDFIHHPMQIARPDWSSTGDYDGDLSARNRREFFESCVGTDLLILGTHFTGAGAGYIVEDGDSYRLAPAPSA